MPTTVHYDPALQVWALQTRTDDAGSDVEDSSAAEGRLVWRMYTEGIVGADSYQVTADGADMSVDVGSGSAFTDLAVVAGDAASLGKYGLLLEPASTTLTVPAADLSNPRIDEVYLVVVDDPGTMVKARLGYRQGDAASSPSAPGPDAGWEGSLLLATVNVGAGVTTISQGDITDERVGATSTVAVAADVGEVDNSTEVASANLTGTMANVAQVQLTIPSDWGSWKCEAYATFAHQSSGGEVLMDALIRIDNTDQQTQQISSHTAKRSGVVGGRRTGITTTGNAFVSLRARETASDVTLRDVYLYARAVRTS